MARASAQIYVPPANARVLRSEIDPRSWPLRVRGLELDALFAGKHWVWFGNATRTSATFACEKLVSQALGGDVRGWMIEDWQPKARRELRAHPSRPRRECLGDRIDGSPHDSRAGGRDARCVCGRCD